MPLILLCQNISICQFRADQNFRYMDLVRTAANTFEKIDIKLEVFFSFAVKNQN